MTVPTGTRADDTAARAHVAVLVQRYPEAAAYDLDLWAAAVKSHLEPLPTDRPWRVLAARHRPSAVAQLAPVVARRLAPADGHRPQPVCPVWCAVTHREVA